MGVGVVVGDWGGCAGEGEGGGWGRGERVGGGGGGLWGQQSLYEITWGGKTNRNKLSRREFKM